MKHAFERLERREMLNGVTPSGVCTCGSCLRAMMQTGDDGRNVGGDYQIGGRWSTTASGSAGAVGNPVTLSWGLVADGLSIPGFNGEPTAPSNLIARLNTRYGSEATWLPLFQSVFDRWSEVSGITYIYQATDDGAAFGGASGALGVRADIRIGGHNIDGGFNILAYNFYPGGNEGGDMVIDTSEFLAGGTFASSANNHRAFRNTLSHEHGHGMGLAHVMPVNNTKLMEPTLSTAFDGPQFDDILAAQRSYGDPLEKNGRNETAATATNLGTLGLGTNVTLAQQVSIANTTDNDYFRFTIDQNRTASFTVTPVGTTYNQGPQSGGSVSSFNAAAQGNLSMAVYDSNGTTVLQSANTNAIGLAESINNLSLNAGTYYVRVLISAGTATPTQMYRLSATIAPSAVLVAPSTPDLSASSDLGFSDTDNITADNTPTFVGTATANTTVQVFDGATLVGTGISDAAGNWTITTSALGNGVHSITAKTTDGVNFSTASAALSITIDTIAPVLLTGLYDREVSQDVTLTFDEAIADQVSAGELTLTNTSTSAVVSIDSLTTSGGNTAVTVAFAGGLLADGLYVLAMPASAVTDLAGNPLALSVSVQFRQLAGDLNNDGTVNFSDLLTLAQNYGTMGKTFSQGNINYDAAGEVGFGDLLLLAQNYGASLFSVVPVTEKTVTKRKTSTAASVL